MKNISIDFLLCKCYT